MRGIAFGKRVQFFCFLDPEDSNTYNKLSVNIRYLFGG